MPSNRGSYKQRWRNEPTDEEIYEDIRRSLEEDYEDEEESYQRGGRGGSSNQRGGGSSSGGSSSSFHVGKEAKMRKMAEAYEKIAEFFEILGEDIQMYLREQEEMSGRRR